ncbi:MAG: zinc-binding dehydrogenase [Candidatus Geothermarchaeales archaeon]
MKVARFYGPRDLRIEEDDVPRPGRGQLLVRVRNALTCGTDVKMWERGHPFVKRPIVLGHEFVGLVEEVGEGVDGFKQGQKVVAANSAPCLACSACRRGNENLCENLEDEIIGFTSPGVYAEYTLIPSRIVRTNTFVVTPELGDEDASFLEPLACVVHGLDVSGDAVRGRVLILGGGPIGLMLLQVAKLRGAEEVVLSDPHGHKLSIARDLGADVTVQARKDTTLRELRAATGHGVDLAIEAVGTVETWGLAFGLTRPGGITLMFGGCKTGEEVSLDAYQLHYQEKRLQGAFHHTPSAVREAFTLLSKRKLVLQPLVTTHLPLGQVEKALEMVSRGEALKVALKP